MGYHVVDPEDVEPGSPHRAFNPADADTTVRVLAVGAPSVEDAHSYAPDEP